MQRQLSHPSLGAPVRFGAVPEGVAPSALGVAHQPWISGQFATVSVKTAMRNFPNGQSLQLDASVEERINGGWVKADRTLQPAAYKPANIPDS